MTCHLRVGNETRTVSAESLQVSDVIEIRVGERVPVDGLVLRGESTVDEAVLTGEPMPTKKTAGHELRSGSMNLTGLLVVQVTRDASNSYAQKIGNLVSEIRKSSFPAQSVGDLLTRRYRVLVPILSVFVGLLWLLSGASPIYSLEIAASMLFVGMPLALHLSTRITPQAAAAKAREFGVLVRDLKALETAFQIQHLAFDKTGTITEGRPEVFHIENESHWSNSVLMQFAASLRAMRPRILARCDQSL